MTFVKHELKMNFKVLFIWSICVGISILGCILLFPSMTEGMEDMAETFSNMKNISNALGMSKISIATMEGYYATTISVIFSLGGAMFAAMIGASLLSKEEEGHTAEFIYVFPSNRQAIVFWKYIALFILVITFNIFCIIFEGVSFLAVDANIKLYEYCIYHLAAFFMQFEIGSICFLISAFCHRKQIGLALGIAIFLYLADIIYHTIPDAKFLKYVTPFYFANATDLFVGEESRGVLLITGVVISLVAAGVAQLWYSRRDLYV